MVAGVVAIDCGGITRIIHFLFVFATMLSVYGKAQSKKVRRGGICL